MPKRLTKERFNELERRARLWAPMALAACVLPGTAGAGPWKTYTDASTVGGLAANGNSVWSGTDGGLVRWDVPSSTYVKYTTTEGLADQLVRDAFVDGNGTLWVGTVAGVQRFDGTTWTTYSAANSPLPNNTVYAIAQDHDGRLWFGTGQGCASFDGSTWQVFTDLGGGATNVAVRGIGVDSSNRVWTANNPRSYGAAGGVSMYNGATWTRFDPDPGSIGQYFLSLAVDSNDRVWAGSWTNWVFKYDGVGWTHYDGSNSGLVGKQVEAFEIQGGNVWIANHASYITQPSQTGVSKFDGSGWSSYTAANSGLPYAIVYSMSATGSVAYFGTATRGTASFDGVTWRTYQTTGEPHSNWIADIDEGAVGAGPSALYFATDHSGIAVLDGGSWSSYTTANSGLGDNYLIDIQIDQGVLWAGSAFTGLFKFNGTTWTNYNTSNSGLLGNGIESIDTDSQGNVWLGTSGWSGPNGQTGALTMFNGASWTNYTLANSGLVNDEALQVAVDSSDDVWVGTQRGVSRFDGVSTWTTYSTSNSGLVDDRINAIAFDSAQNVWFATPGGLSRFDGASTWTSHTTANGLPSNEVRDVRTSATEGVWVATAAGAAVLRNGTWTAYNQGQGLCDNDLMAIAISGDRTVWFGSYESGLSSLSDFIFADGFQSGAR